MSKNKQQVKIAVPKPQAGRKGGVRTMGVFLGPDKGVLTVDIPYGLYFGDEFEFTYDATHEFVTSKTLRLPLPFGVTPGVVFKHRVPNGKYITISCPPGIAEGDTLLVPWNDSNSEHFICQAQIAPPEPVKTNKPPSPPNGPKNASNAFRPAIARYVDDDFRLAQALSLTTLQRARSVEEQEMERVMKASLMDAVKHQQEQQMRVFTGGGGGGGHTPVPPPEDEDKEFLERVLKESRAEMTEEDRELERVLKASMEEFVHPKPPSSNAFHQDDDDEEEALIRRAAEQSLKEAHEKQRAAYVDNYHVDDAPPDPSDAELRTKFLMSLPEEVRMEVLRQEAVQAQSLAALEQQQY